MNEIYKFLKENELTTLNEKEFLNKYSTPEKAAEIHSFFKENDLTTLDSNTFYDKYLKKKDSTQGAGRLGVTPSLSASSGEIAGGFGDVVKQTQGLQKPTAKPKQESDFVKGLRGGDKLGRTISSLDGVEAFNNAIQRGMLSGERADLLNISQGFSDADVKRLAEINTEIESFKSSPAYQKFNEAVSESDGGKFFEAIAENPIGVFTELITESMTALARHGYSRALAGTATGAAAGSVVPGVGTIAGAGGGLAAGMGLASINLEYSGSIMESLQEIGVDTKDANAIKKAFSDEDRMNDFRNAALKRGVPIGLIDMLSMGVAGRFAANPTASIGKKILGQTAEVATQAGFGGLGEATAQVVSGEKLNPYAILSEMMAEPVTSAPEIAIGAMVHNKKTGKATPSELVASVVTDPNVTPDVISEMLDISVGAGEITQQQKADIMSELDAMSSAAGKVPADLSDKVPQLAPIILQKQGIDAEITAKTAEKMQVDEAFHGAIDEQINALEEQKKALNEQIQAIATTSVEPTATQVGEVAEPTQQEAGGVVEGVQADSVGESDVPRITEGFEVGILDGIRSFMSTISEDFSFRLLNDISGNIDSRIASAEYIDSLEIDSVVGDLIKYADSISKKEQLSSSQKKSLLDAIDAKIDQLLNYEFATISETETVAERTATKSIITTPREGVRQTVSKERFAGAEVMSKGSKGKIEKNGNFLDLVFGNTRIPLDFNFVEFVESRLDKNGDLAVTLVDTRSGTEFMLMDNELSLDVAISESQKQIGVVPEGDFDIVVQEVVTESQKQTKKLANPEKQKTNEEAKQEPLLAESRSNRVQDEAGQEGSSLRSEKEKVGGKDANEKSGTEGVDARQQAEDGKGVGKQDSKGEEVTKKSKEVTPVQEALKKQKEKREAAIAKLKKSWNDAKNTGISTDFEKRMKEDAEFFGAIRDIIQTNIEIGAITLRESLNDIADILGVKLSALDKKAVEKVFNKEVLSALKKKQSADFERQDVRAALGEYIQENKKILGEAANAQALKLVNEAETEAGFERAYEYIEKLINNQEFRDAIGKASKATKNASPELRKLGIGRAAIDFFSKLKVAAITEVGLMQQLAEILSNPSQHNPARIQKLMTDIQTHLDEQAKNAEKPTQESVMKKIEGLLTKRTRDEDGNMQTTDKEFDTPAKIRALARSIANVENQIFGIENLSEADEATLIAMLDEAKNVLNDAKSNAAEAIESFRKQNIEDAKEVVKAINDGSLGVNPDVAEATGLYAMMKNLDAIDELDYYESQKLMDGLQLITNGFKPLGFYRGVAAGIINAPQRNAIRLAAENIDDITQQRLATYKKYGGATGFIKKLLDYARYGKEFVKAGEGLANPNAFTDKDSFLADMLTRGLANLDKLLYVNMWESRPLATNILKPLSDALNNLNNDRTNTERNYLKDSGRKISNFKSARGIISRNKVGFFLAQQSENAVRNKYNMLQKTAEYYEKNGFTKDGMDAQRNAVIALAKQYPDGIKESDLTDAEKAMAKAFKKQFDENLQQKQAKAALTAGDPFDPLVDYYPYIASAEVSQFVSENPADVKEVSNQLLRGATNQAKNPKIRSDRNLQRDENAEFFPIIGDIDVVLDIAASQVLKQYHLQPTLINAVKAMNTMKKWASTKARGGEDFISALQDAYVAEVNARMSGLVGIGYKIASALQNTYVANRLMEVSRVTGEVVTGGFAMWGLMDSPNSIKRPNLSINRKINERYGASILQRKPVNMEKNVWDRVKETYTTLTSPDAINTKFWAETFFATSLSQEYKKISGNELDYSKLNDDSYVDSIDKDLEKAYDATIVKMSSVYNSMSIGKPIATRMLGSGSAMFRKDASQMDRLLNQMTMLFGNYAADVGNDLTLAFQSKERGARNEEVLSSARKARKLTAVLAQGMMYNLIIELTITAAEYGYEKFIDDDDEEAQKVWDEYVAGITSPEKIVSAGLGSILYFGLGPYGSIGKVASYLGMVFLSWLYQQWKDLDMFASKAEADLAIKSLDDMSRDMFYKGIPRNEKEYMQNSFELGAGGLGFIAKETIDAGNLASDMLNGNTNTLDALYGIGLLMNATIGRKYGIPFPFAQTFEKASRKVAEKGFESTDPEKIAKAARLDANKKNSLINNYAIQTYVQEVKEGNPNALRENKKALREALKERGFSNEQIKKDVKRMEDKYKQEKLPAYLYKIVSNDVPRSAAIQAARDFSKLKKEMENAMRSGDDVDMKRAQEAIAVFRKTIRDEKMPVPFDETPDEKRVEFRKEFRKELEKLGIEY